MDAKEAETWVYSRPTRCSHRWSYQPDYNGRKLELEPGVAGLIAECVSEHEGKNVLKGLAMGLIAGIALMIVVTGGAPMAERGVLAKDKEIVDKAIRENVARVLFPDDDKSNDKDPANNEQSK
jgi:hypothetical protein